MIASFGFFWKGTLVADIAVISPALAGVAYTETQVTAADRFVAQAGGAYLLIVNNAAAAPTTVTLDDVNSPTPVGAKAFNPDVDVVVPANSKKIVRVDANRFLSSADGKVGIATTPTTTCTVAIFGPL